MNETAASRQQTLSSQIDTSALKDLHGRKLNNTDNSYGLPADSAEHHRLDLQHEMLKSATGGLYLAREAVQKALSPRADGTTPRVLDIGTGSGKWAIDMATEFPHAEVAGLDLAPVNPSSKVLPNCRFILGDCNTCLDDPSYESAFDLIHARCITPGIFNYRNFIQYIWKALRPGGVFLAIEGRPGSFNEHRQQLGVQDEDDPGYSWCNKLFSLTSEAMAARNNQFMYFDDVPAWLKDMGGAWEDFGDQRIWITIGAWDKSSPELVFQGEAMRQNCSKFTESVKPLLLLQGHPEESVQKWAQNARKELEELPFRLCGKWGSVWAVKRTQG